MKKLSGSKIKQSNKYFVIGREMAVTFTIDFCFLGQRGKIGDFDVKRNNSILNTTFCFKLITVLKCCSTYNNEIGKRSFGIMTNKSGQISIWLKILDNARVLGRY